MSGSLLFIFADFCALRFVVNGGESSSREKIAGSENASGVPMLTSAKPVSVSPPQIQPFFNVPHMLLPFRITFCVSYCGPLVPLSDDLPRLVFHMPASICLRLSCLFVSLVCLSVCLSLAASVAIWRLLPSIVVESALVWYFLTSHPTIVRLKLFTQYPKRQEDHPRRRCRLR